MNLSSILTPPLLALCAAGIPAQGTTKIVPILANVFDGNSQTYFPFIYDAFRYQQIWDGAQIANTGATINAIAFRRDTQDNTMFAGRTIPAFDLLMGHAATTPATMSTTYGANISGGLLTAFSASLNLPSQPPVMGRTGQFNVVIPLSTPFTYTRAQGDLLAEYVVQGVAMQKVFYKIDADRVGADGEVLSYGTGGSFGGSSLTPRMTWDSRATPVTSIVPGGSIALRVSSIPSATNSTFINFGLSTTFFVAGFLPFDLGLVGATGNTLYASVTAVNGPLPLVPAGSNYQADLTMPIPNDPALAGKRWTNQSISLDPTANALGAVFSNALNVVIGGIPGTPVTNMMGDPSSTQAAGGLIYRNGAGGPVTQFTGTFN